jgi:hypothetical protein
MQNGVRLLADGRKNPGELQRPTDTIQDKKGATRPLPEDRPVERGSPVKQVVLSKFDGEPWSAEFHGQVTRTDVNTILRNMVRWFRLPVMRRQLAKKQAQILEAAKKE